MRLGAKAIAWLLAGAASLASFSNARSAQSRPVAWVVLEVDSAQHIVQILDQSNVSVRIVAAEGQDLNIAKAFDLECRLAGIGKLVSVGAYADTKSHLIPIDVLDYKDYDPSYVKLEVAQIYLANKIEDSDRRTHKVTIEFYQAI